MGAEDWQGPWELRTEAQRGQGGAGRAPAQGSQGRVSSARVGCGRQGPGEDRQTDRQMYNEKRKSKCARVSAAVALTWQALT